MVTGVTIPRIKHVILSLVGGVILATAAATSARADVVAVVSAKSAVGTLSKTQISEIFLGKMSHLPNGAPVVLIDQPAGSAEREEFYTRIVGKSAAQVREIWAKITFTGRGLPPKEVANSLEVRRRVGQNPAAIGYIDSKFVDDSVRVVL
jgi:ABC-type phosphate transport system substrate-binding protein